MGFRPHAPVNRLVKARLLAAARQPHRSVAAKQSMRIVRKRATSQRPVRVSALYTLVSSSFAEHHVPHTEDLAPYDALADPVPVLQAQPAHRAA